MTDDLEAAKRRIKALEADLHRAIVGCEKLAGRLCQANSILENVVEYAESFFLALTDHDKPHQTHFREMTKAWIRRAYTHLGCNIEEGRHGYEIGHPPAVLPCGDCADRDERIKELEAELERLRRCEHEDHSKYCYWRDDELPKIAKERDAALRALKDRT